MNLSEAFDAALPELPVQRALRTFPKLHPKLVWREHIEGGVAVFVAHVPGNPDILRFAKAHWGLVQLFDGNRSYEEVAQTYLEETGVVYEEAELRQFAATMRDNGLWQQTVGQQYGAGHIHAHSKAKKSRWTDLTHIDFSAWDPDVFLTRAYRHLKFIYSGWSTGLAVALVRCHDLHLRGSLGGDRTGHVSSTTTLRKKVCPILSNSGFYFFYSDSFMSLRMG